MKLDDFDEEFTEPIEVRGEQMSRKFYKSVHPDHVKSYIQSKLREFGGRLKQQSVPGGYDGSFEGARLEGYNESVSKLNAQIDAELKELE